MATKTRVPPPDAEGLAYLLLVLVAMVVMFAIAEWRANAAVNRAIERRESHDCVVAGGEYVQGRTGYVCVGDR
jgi:uncharacterized protein (DUF58 family)